MKEERWENIGSKFAHLTSVHPCYNEKAHFTTARIHLPVAPRCNIQCNYCIRKLDKCEHRPGVASGILNPQEALVRVDRYIKEMPQLRVVGIAGPGESLANEETFETMHLVHDKYPQLIKCVATNGLLLPEKVGMLIDVGVTSVTVTINSVDPEVGARISAENGAIIMNIIPLIPLHKFEKERTPDCDELTIARTLAEEFLPQFRLCRQCRADAIGIPGFEPCGSPIQQRTSGEYYHA